MNVKVNKLSYEYEGMNESLTLTASHYVHIQRNGTKMHIASSKAMTGDKLFKVTANGEQILVEILKIQTFEVKSEELIAIYTESKTFLANNLVASSVSEGDYNEYWHPAASTVAKMGG